MSKPAAATAKPGKGKKKVKQGGAGADKAKFRVMHHKYHDEPEWHVDDRDELAFGRLRHDARMHRAHRAGPDDGDAEFFAGFQRDSS